MELSHFGWTTQTTGIPTFWRRPQPAVKLIIQSSPQSELDFFHLIMSTRILLLGSGGREHALVWKLSRSPLIDHIYVCPGNPGTQQELKTLNIIDIPLNDSDFPRLVDFALAHKVWLFSIRHLLSIKICKVGLLVHSGWRWSLFRNGLNFLDVFRTSKVTKIFSRHIGVWSKCPCIAARLEGSKAFSMDFMARHHIPTAKSKYSTLRKTKRLLSMLRHAAIKLP